MDAPKIRRLLKHTGRPQTKKIKLKPQAMKIKVKFATKILLTNLLDAALDRALEISGVSAQLKAGRPFTQLWMTLSAFPVQ